MPLRVVSLVPSLTETVLAWGVIPVAVTRFCEHPELPAVGGTKDPDLDAIVALHPDVVLVNTEENRREDVDALAAAGVAVHVTEVERVADVVPMLEGLAARLGLDGRVAAPVAAALPPPLPYDGPPRLTAFVPIWRRPWMTMNGSTFGSSMLEHLGIANAFAAAPERYPETTLAAAAELRPDVVLAPSEPYPFGERHVAELEAVAPVVLVDGQDLFWWGVRTPAALERLARQLGEVRPR